MKQFNNKAVLTTQNPEAFLTFKYTVGDTSLWITPNSSIGEDILYVNGLDIYDSSESYALQMSPIHEIASFHVYTRKLYDFDTNLQFICRDTSEGGTIIETIDVSILNRPFIINSDKINVYDNESILIEGEASYLVLRSNPKFSGNIKIVVDTSDNIFLDTFKVSDILSSKQYRKQQISANSVLADDVRKIFSSLPLGELYSDDTLNIALPSTELSNQYYTAYNYGSYLLKDELYTQDNGILAPLWINSTIPDYFSVFKLPGVYNTETYNNTSLENLAINFLKGSDIIQSWSLKETSPIGLYLKTHLDDINSIPGYTGIAPVFLSLTDPSIIDAEADPNTWYGIAVDKGILTGRSETPYFFNQKINNFTELNAFVSTGFERNNLLCPHLLNLEYIFDDDASMYTMSRYFGLYLTENILYEIGYYSSSVDSSVGILSMDGRDSSIFLNSNIFDASGNFYDNYKNRILVLNDGITLKRIKKLTDITINNEYNSKPYKNLFSSKISKKEYKPFITLTINNLLHQGEQLRLINKTTNKIWEIFGVDSSLYCDKYVSFNESSTNYPKIYQTSFSVKGSIDDQLHSIESAFDRFAEYEDGIFRCGLRGDNWISIILNDDADTSNDWQFQRITAQTRSVFSDPSTNFNSAAKSEDITFFGRYTPDSSAFTTINYDASFGPINFELFGDRKTIFVSLFNSSNNNLYNFDSTVIDNFDTYTLYQNTNQWYKLIQNFNITLDTSSREYQYVLDPLSLTTKYLIQTEDIINTNIDNIWNAYSLYPLTISLMGINPVKDIDYTVYDASLNSRSEYWYNRENDISTYLLNIVAGTAKNINISNSYAILSGTGTIIKNTSINSYTSGYYFNTFDGSVDIQATTTTSIAYNTLSASSNFRGYSASSGIYEESIKDYYDSSSLLKYSLTAPTVSKWVGTGTDCRNNDFRLILNSSIFYNSSIKSNFIPIDSHFSGEISYPSFKYLSSGERNWEDYIFYDVNDTVKYVKNSTTQYKTIKDLMFDEPYIDIFSKLIYSNNEIQNTKTRSSIVYYNEYSQSLNTLFLGLNFSFKLQGTANILLDLKNYNKYRFSFISISSKNRDDKRPIEFIVNENTKTILMIWYQGNDILNYTLRNSRYSPGKSLLDPSDCYFVTTSDPSYNYYSFTKAPFFVNNSNLAKNIVNVYGISSWYDSSMANPYAQLNWGTTIHSFWNPYDTNMISFGGLFAETASYNTFTQAVNYTYLKNSTTFGNNVVNYGYKYNSNENIYSACSLDNLKYFSSSSKDFVKYYIIKENLIYTNSNFTLPPFTITINSPRLYNGLYNYNGWIRPKFNNIIEFNYNEENNFINIVQKDFILSNTSIRTYKNINQLWYNTVVTSVTSTDVSKGNAIDYKSFNVFNSLWDASYYKIGTSGISGYASSAELPSFFGSKLIKLPNYLDLLEWTTSTLQYSEKTNNYIFSYNLTKAISELFKSNSIFLNNWNGLSNTSNTIDNYIKDTILSYYNISVSAITVNLYIKPYDNERLHYTYDSAFTKDIIMNINSESVIENNEYIYRITIPKKENYSYYVSFRLFEK